MKISLYGKGVRLTMKLVDAKSSLPSSRDEARRALGAGSDARFVMIEGRKVAYFDVGDGPPIVCLHAIGHGAGDFFDLARRLSPSYRVIAIDWPGHGLSDDDASPVSVPRFAETLDAVLDALSLPPAVVLGNSIGGAAALSMADANPKRVAGLVLEDPGGLDRVDATARIFCGAMSAFFRAGAEGASWFPRAYALYYAAVLRTEAARWRRAAIVHAGPAMAPRLAEAWSFFGRPEADQRAIAARVQTPTLVAWSRGDRIIQLRRNRDGIARLRNARLAIFEGGHAAHLEAPVELERILRAFLAEVAAVRSDFRA